MANPIKKRSDNNLQEMTDAEMDYIVNRVLTSFASTSTVSVNPGSTAGLTNIGTFVDTVRDDSVGTHPTSGTTSSTNFVFYQDRQSQSEASMIRPLEFSSSQMRQQNDTQLNDSIITRCLNNLVASGIGMYKLQVNAPSDGTWTSRATITNTVVGASSNTTKLWQKTAGTTPTVIRPIKLRSDNDVQEMTDAEIQNLVARLRNRITATGIGTYALQSSAPTGGGTWVAAGSGFDDTRREVGNVNYSSNFSNTFSNTFAGNYSANYAGSRTRFWNGSQGLTYFGSYSGFRTKYFTGFFTGFFTGTFTGATILSSTETASSATLWMRTA